MTSLPPIVDEAELLVRALADVLTSPRENECLCCYVARQLEEFGCDGSHRHAVRYRDARAPRSTALRERLNRVGSYCDCELFLNGYIAVADLDRPEDDDSVAPLLPCQGVRRGSVRPCANWTRLRRW